ncbi:MAG: DUF1631 domain-containing protein [Thiobacillus sp.]|nr:DUF1631 domain-containing protein [Thiobacillus sp.]
MKTQSAPLSPAALLREADARMAQALDNFFQRRRAAIQDAIVRALSAQMTPSTLATGQTCLDWLNAYPEALSTAFADQFRLHLARPETFGQRHGDHPATLQLVDDNTFSRQLAEEKVAAHLTETLRAEMVLLFGRMQGLRRAALEDQNHAEAYGPLPVMRALSRALDAQGIDSQCGTFLIQCATASLLDTLKHTYASLNQFLGTQDLPEPPVVPPAPPPRRTAADAGQDILAHIQAIVARSDDPGLKAAEALSGRMLALPQRLIDSLESWQTRPGEMAGQTSGTPALVLRQLQVDARQAGTGTFDLAVLDAVAGLFEFILDDPAISPRYKAAIGHLQIPALRVALVEPVFFSDEQHPARQMIDLMGLFSRRFPEHNPSHAPAIEQIEAVCTTILNNPGHPAEAFARAHSSLAAWLADENARSEVELASEVAHLERIERQELGTLLALENLHDLTERYPAPESVLRRLEAAWVPHMASLYVAESGEGPDWRAACLTLLQLFLSLQAPDSDAARESRLRSIPPINTALRQGLLAQGAEPAQLKDFFSAITATQECWIRPDVGQREAVVSTFTPLRISQEQVESLAHQLADTPTDDPILKQTQQLLEGDWVDFDPPFDGLATARVAWVGVHGYLLFCDSAGEQRFSLDCDRLAAEIRAGRAQIPEQSLTRKAMLRLKTHLSSSPS